jgi:hypothetical protein
MALIAQGSKRIALGDRVYEYGPGQYLVASVDLPVTGLFTRARPDEPALGFGLVLRPALIAEILLQAAPGDLPPTSAAAPPGMVVSDAPAPLVDAVVRLLRLLDNPRDAAVLAPLVKREILWRLITGEQGATVRQLGLADSGLAHVARAVRPQGTRTHSEASGDCPHRASAHDQARRRRFSRAAARLPRSRRTAVHEA